MRFWRTASPGNGETAELLEPLDLQVKKGFQELVLSARQDDFYKKHMYNNFGDIGTAVKDLVDDFQRHSAKGKSMDSLEDMQSFVENYSEFSAAQRNASKHVTLISTLSGIVDSRSLMQARRRFSRIHMAEKERPLLHLTISSAVQRSMCTIIFRTASQVLASFSKCLRLATSMTFQLPSQLHSLRAMNYRVQGFISKIS